MVGAPIRRARRAAKAALLDTPYIPPSQRKAAEQFAPKPEPKPAPRPKDDGWIDEPEKALERLAEAHKQLVEPEVETADGRIVIDESLVVDQKQFDNIVELSLKRAVDIMKIKPGDEQWTPQIAARQTAIITSVMTTLARIDEARLRRQRESGVSRVLAEIRRQKALAV